MKIRKNIKVITGIIFILFILVRIFQQILTSRNRPKRYDKCNGINIEDVQIFSKKNKFPNSIPKIVHYIYKTEKIPYQYAALIKDCQKLNQDVLFLFWDDESSQQMIFKFYPLYINMYETYLKKKVDPLKKSDIFRYFLLEQFGGIYMDLDTRCQIPLNNIMDQYSCILSREVEIVSRILWNMNYIAMNSFMASVPNHEFFKFLIKNIRNEQGKSIHYETGPIFLTKTLDYYRYQMKITDINDILKYVYVASSDTFSPFVEKYVDDKCRAPSEVSLIQACGSLRDYRMIEQDKIKSAIVVHLFLHLGYKWGKKRIKMFQDICYKTNISLPIINEYS